MAFWSRGPATMWRVPISTHLSAPHRPNVLLWTILYYCTQLDCSSSWDSDMPVVFLICCFPAYIQGSLKDASKCPASCRSSASADCNPASPWVSPCSALTQAFVLASVSTQIQAPRGSNSEGGSSSFNLQRGIQKSTE